MTLLILSWGLWGAGMLLWSGLCWWVHGLLQDPKAQVLAMQRALHALSVPEGWGAWAHDMRDALVNAGDSLLLLASLGLNALVAWWPAAIRTLDVLLWGAWALGALAGLVVAVVLHAVIRASARNIAAAPAA